MRFGPFCVKKTPSLGPEGRIENHRKWWEMIELDFDISEAILYRKVRRFFHMQKARYKGTFRWKHKKTEGYVARRKHLRCRCNCDVLCCPSFFSVFWCVNRAVLIFPLQYALFSLSFLCHSFFFSNIVQTFPSVPSHVCHPFSLFISFSSLECVTLIHLFCNPTVCSIHSSLRPRDHFWLARRAYRSEGANVCLQAVWAFIFLCPVTWSVGWAVDWGSRAVLALFVCTFIATFVRSVFKEAAWEKSKSAIDCCSHMHCSHDTGNAPISNAGHDRGPSLR